MSDRRVQFFILPVFVFLIIPVIVLFKPPTGLKDRPSPTNNSTGVNETTPVASVTQISTEPLVATGTVTSESDLEGSGEESELPTTGLSLPLVAPSIDRQWSPKFRRSPPAETCERARGDLGGWVCDGELIFE